MIFPLKYWLGCIACAIVFSVDAQEPPLEPLQAEETPDLPVQCFLETLLMEQRMEHLVRLRLEGAPAAELRCIIDLDEDGHVSMEESQGYLRERSGSLGREMRLRVDGTTLPLVPQGDAELDFEQERGVGEYPLVLQISLLSALPRQLNKPRELLLEHQFFPDQELQMHWQARQAREEEFALVGKAAEVLPAAPLGAWRPLKLPLMGLAGPPAKQPASAKPAANKEQQQDEAARARMRQRLDYFRQGPIDRSK